MNSQFPTNSQFVCVTFIVLCRQNEKKIQRNDRLFGAGLSFHEETVENRDTSRELHNGVGMLKRYENASNDTCSVFLQEKSAFSLALFGCVFCIRFA